MENLIYGAVILLCVFAWFHFMRKRDQARMFARLADDGRKIKLQLDSIHGLNKTTHATGKLSQAYGLRVKVDSVETYLELKDLLEFNAGAGYFTMSPYTDFYDNTDRDNPIKLDCVVTVYLVEPDKFMSNILTPLLSETGAAKIIKDRKRW